MFTRYSPTIHQPPHMQKWTIDLLFKNNRICKNMTNFKTFNCPKATEALWGYNLILQFTVYYSVPSSSWQSFNWPWKDKKMNWPWRYPAVLNSGFVDWESSALTNAIIGKRYVKCNCPVFLNIKPTLHYKVAIE